MLFSRRISITLAGVSALVSCVGTFAVGFTWGGYSPIRQTVSTLAAHSAPTRTWMNLVLLITAAALGALALVLPNASRLGCVLLGLAAAAVVAAVLLPFPAPDTDTGPHTAAVTTAMVMLGFAPLGMCAPWRRNDWRMRLVPVVAATAVLVVLGFTFLGNWLHKTPTMGLIERIFIAAEMVCLVWVVSRGIPATESVAAMVTQRDTESNAVREQLLS